MLKGDQPPSPINDNSSCCDERRDDLGPPGVMTDAWTSHENSPQPIRVLGADDDANSNAFSEWPETKQPRRNLRTGRAEDLFVPASAALPTLLQC